MKERELGKYTKTESKEFSFKRKSRVNEEKELLAEETLGDDFYEKLCRAYINTARLEWVTTNPENNSVVHGYFVDDDESDKYGEGSEITPENYKDIMYSGYTEDEIADGYAEVYEYDNWEDFFEEYVKGEILNDIRDIGVDSTGEWDFYISKDDLDKVGIQYNLDESVEKNNNGGFYKDGKYYLGDPDSDEYDEVTYEGDIADKLWTAACCGDNKYLQDYYANGGEPNVRPVRFGGTPVSLIIGALNNKCYDTVELLIKNGETILPEELEQYKKLMGAYRYEDEVTRKVSGELNESKKVIENNNSNLYDELSRVLTDYEGNGDENLKDDPKPLYDMLVKIQNNWGELCENKSVNESKKVEGFKLGDRAEILDTTERRGMPIALVKLFKGGRYEYIVAFGYTTDNDEVSWNYGYYYYDEQKGKEAFDKVKQGGHLNTMD